MKLIKYIKSSFDEVIHKVTWPKLGQLQSTSLLVLIASVIFSVLIFAIDKGFSSIMSFIYAL